PTPPSCSATGSAWCSGRRRSASAWISSEPTASAGRWRSSSPPTLYWSSAASCRACAAIWVEEPGDLTFRRRSLCVAPSFPRPGHSPDSAAPEAARTPDNPTDEKDGQGCKTQDQAAVDRRYRFLLRDEQEQPHEDRQAVVPQIRPGRQEACRIQGNQDQVGSGCIAAFKRRLRAAFFVEACGN